MRYVSWLLVIFFLLVVILFSSLNSHDVVIDLYFSKMHVVLSFILFIALLLGVLVMSLVALVQWLKMKSKISKLNGLLKLKQKEIDDLRQAPIKDL